MAYRESRVALVLCKNCTVKFPIDKLTVIIKYGKENRQV